MTDGHSYSALRDYNRVTAALVADPEVTGNLLLLGLWLARATILRDPPKGPTGWSAADAARALFPLRAGQPNTWRVRDLLRQDIRRYDYRAEPGNDVYRVPCGSPTPRKPACGKPDVISSLFTDPATGRRRLVGACRQHLDWYREQDRANREACAAVEVPRPPANTGGRLARHIRLDWPKLWSSLDPDWSPPPEVEAWERPNLRLVVSPEPARESEVASSRPATARRRFALISGALS